MTRPRLAMLRTVRGYQPAATVAAVGVAALVVAVPLGVTRTPHRASCHGAAATMIGSSGFDRLRGTDGRDVIVGFGGNDKIHARGGRDLICGRHGDDDVTAGPGRDRILGGPGSDDIWAGAGRDGIRGGSGYDFCGGAPRHRTFRCEAPVFKPPPPP